MNNATRLVTAEEFWLQPEGEVCRELIRGQIAERPLPGGQSGVIASACGMQLRLWADQHDQGEVGGRSGFILARHPDTVRAPAVFYIRSSNLPRDGIPEGFWELAPTLAVEIVAPTDLEIHLHDRIRDFLDAGTQLVWVIYPHVSEVVAHTPDGLARTYRSDDLLTDPEVLPGFSCIVKDLFE